MTMIGKKHSEETKEKIRVSNLNKNKGKQVRLGKKLSIESKNKLSNSCKGRWKGMTYEQIYGEEKAKEIKLKRIISAKLRKGIKFSLQGRQNMSAAFKGDKNPNWKGGLSSETEILRCSLEYKLWREAVFIRDNYTCVWCGDKHGGNLEADHILLFSTNPEHRFSIDNGRTLCHDCHIKRHRKN